MKKYKFIGTIRDSIGYGSYGPVLNEIYPEDQVFCGENVRHWANCYYLGISKEWEEVIQEPTLESLTNQIYELAKKQGMRCDVVLEKKKEVEVKYFEVTETGYLQITHVSFSVDVNAIEIESKQSEIIKAIKTILEND